MVPIIEIVPTEAHHRNGLVKRDHTYLQTVYEKLCLGVSRFSREEQLSMLFSAVNDAAASGTGIAHSTLVYGVY